MDCSWEEMWLFCCLNIFDLVVFGVGSILGVGVYVLVGVVVCENVGFVIVIFFLIVVLVLVLVGLCYGEFGVWVFKMGLVYFYSYVIVGEFWVFIIGWNLIFFYIIGILSVVRVWSVIFDELIGRFIGEFLWIYMILNVFGVLVENFDIFVVIIIFILIGFLIFGVKELVMVNKIFICINVLVLGFIMVLGFVKGLVKNW